MFYRFTTLAALIAAPVFIGFSLVAPEFCAVFLGGRWAHVTLVMQLVVLVGVVQSISYFNGGLLIALGRPDLRVHAVSLRAVVGTCLFLACHFLGILGFSLAFLIRGISAEPLQLFFVNTQLREFGLRTYFSGILPFFGYALVMAAAVWLLDLLLLHRFLQSEALILVAKTGVGASLYSMLVVFFEKGRLRELRRMLKSG
jgi:PST family polysaccharide transporter